jgi:predicted nucleotidyltransferase
MTLAITVDRRKIHHFCRKHHIRRLAFFGSVLRTDFDTESDVDVLVEFEHGHTPGLKFFAIQDELSKILRRNVDLNTPQFLPSNFRKDVMTGAETHYDHA